MNTNTNNLTKRFYYLWEMEKYKIIFILSRILVTRQVINGFRIRWSDLLDIHQTELN
jgi:hypothetical protein